MSQPYNMSRLRANAEIYLKRRFNYQHRVFTRHMVGPVKIQNGLPDMQFLCVPFGKVQLWAFKTAGDLDSFLELKPHGSVRYMKEYVIEDFETQLVKVLNEIGIINVPYHC